MQSTANKHILIIDDDQAVVMGISIFLKKRGFQTSACHRPQLVLETIEATQPDLVILDMNFSIETSGKEGLALLRQIRHLKPDLPVILMTGWATVQLAVEGMKIGAKDFIAKPWDNNTLLKSIQFILDTNTSPSKSAQHSANLIGDSPEFKDILHLAGHIAPTDASVLITGESGTGKEVIAEYIHRLSKRSSEAFVKVNLGGISTSLFESEMFGHKKGAFTGAHIDRQGRFMKAHKGTIFLDEIGELGSESQVKLLRVLQEKTFEVLGSSEAVHTDVRVISATNKDLHQLVNQSLFREDLLYRINLITIHMPALRERREDIPLLANHFASQIAKTYGIDEPTISYEAMAWLQQQELPGNIRQLKNWVERVVLLNMSQKDLDLQDFIHLANSQRRPEDYVRLPDVGTAGLDEIEKEMIIKTLHYHHHSISKTAKALNLSRAALYRRLSKYRIPHEPKS